MLLPACIGRPTRALSLAALLGVVLCAFGSPASSAEAAPIIDYPSFSSVAGLQLNGSAAQNGSSLRLTESAEFEDASTFSKTAIVPSKPWSTEFELSMYEANAFGAADGIVFTLQPNSTTALGEAGGGEGYAGISPSLGLEFDTYDANPGDPPANDIGLLQDGRTNAFIECATEFEVAAPCTREFDFPLYSQFSTPFYAWVSYDGAGTVSVYASSTPTEPATPLLQAKVNLSDLGNSSFAGFTAATGSGTSVQEALGWQLSGTPAPQPKVTSVTPSSGSRYGNTPVTIKGSGFEPGATVIIGDEAHEVDVVSETEIKARTLASLPESDEVRVSQPNGTSTGGPTYTFLETVGPPHVESITPEEGTTAGGNEVVIKGSGFEEGATVTIGAKASSVDVISEDEIRAVTAAESVGSHEVVVSEAGGTSKNGPRFTYKFANDPPDVQSITPTEGPTTGGTEVTITGTSFEAEATVTIGEAEATGVQWVNEDELKVRTPAGVAGPATVVVEDAGGRSSSSSVTFTYVAPPPPTVSQIKPSSGSTSGGTKVVIKGAGFEKGAKVIIGTDASEVDVVSQAEITATTTATSPGEDEVVVQDAKGTSTGGPSFTYDTPSGPPTVESINPSSGPSSGGTAVIIKGAYFKAPATVTIGNAATAVEVISETEIKARTTATAAGSDTVVVSDEEGSSTEGPSFTYLAPPHVSSIGPTSGPAGGGTAVVIKGSGFVAGASVKIGSAATAVEVLGPGEIKAKTAATAAGADEVVVSDEGDTSTGGPSFTYLAVPHVTSIEPTSGPVGGGTAVVIKGSGFVAGATVKIGSPATAVEVVDPGEIKAKTAAAAAGADEVVVSDEGGTSTGGPSFTYVAVPHVSAIEPTSGPVGGGTAIVIKGSGFLAGATVKIGSSATAVEVLSPGEIRAKTAATAAGSDEVVVSDEGGTSTGGPSFTYLGPPHVSSIEPSSGPASGGTAVVIKGSGFRAGATVKIGSAATAVEVLAPGEIKAKTAVTAAGADEVIVTDEGGTSTGGPSFTYVTTPQVSSIEPASGPTGGGTAVVIKGSGFTSPATVTIGSAATAVEVLGPGEIRAKTTATAAGAEEVVVSDGGGTSTGGPSFTYLAAPHVSSIEPSSGSVGGGTVVMVKGSGFLAGATVKIGSAATAVEVIGAAEIRATTTATAAGGDEVVVSDANGTSTGGPFFTYLMPGTPHVSAIEPSSGPAGGGTAVVIKGSGFVAGATVKIGSAATAVNVISSSEITATAAASAAGSDEVVVSDENGTSSGGPSYTYVASTSGGEPPVTANSNATGGNATPKSGILATTAIMLAPPTLGLTGNLAPISGTVLVKLPGTSTFVSVTSLLQIPFGTVIDATNGRVTITTVGPHGEIQTMTFFEGEFKLTQGRNGRVLATLFGGDFSVCPTAQERSHIARASSSHSSGKHAVRKLWAEGHGSYSTKGNYAAGAVLGTRWLTEDLCEGTLIHVATDKVAVVNLVTHHHLTVNAGHSYLAKAAAR